MTNIILSVYDWHAYKKHCLRMLSSLLHNLLCQFSLSRREIGIDLVSLSIFSSTQAAVFALCFWPVYVLVLGAWACSLKAAVRCKPAPAALAPLDFLVVLGLDSIAAAKGSNCSQFYCPALQFLLWCVPGFCSEFVCVHQVRPSAVSSNLFCQLTALIFISSTEPIL